MRYLKTSEIAKAVGLHPNTIRLYEEWGLLTGISRSPAGYRQYKAEHLDQVKLIRLVMKCSLFGKEVKHTAYDVITYAARSNFKEALSSAERLEMLLRKEYHQAREAEHFLEEWGRRYYVSEGCSKQNTTVKNTVAAISRNEAAKLLDITPDTLRDWERNNLIAIPRDAHNGYRIYGEDEINKLRVIRVLRRSNYSNMAILRAVQRLESGSAEGLKDALDSPEIDEERGYLCFTDTLLTSLNTAQEASTEIIKILREKADQAMPCFRADE